MRRRDFETNLIWEGISLFAFYHPAMHWIKRRLVESREVVCDELAAKVTSDRIAYALVAGESGGTVCGDEEWGRDGFDAGVFHGPESGEADYEVD